MVAKCLLVLCLVAVAYGVPRNVEEIRLPDETTRYLSNPFTAKSISIPQLILDTLISCYVIYPNGAVHELFPSNNLPQSEFTSSTQGGAFNSCGMFFRNAPPELGGTYELLGRVDHWDGRKTLTMQRYHLEFYYSDSWQIPSKK